MLSSPPTPRGLARFVRACARAAAHHPKTVIGLWLTLVVACTVLGSMAGTHALSDSASGVGQSQQAQNTLTRVGLQGRAREEILIRSASARHTAAATRVLATRARALPAVAAVSTPLHTPGLTRDGGRTALVIATLRGDPDDADDHVVGLEHLVSTMRAQTPVVSLQETGDGSGERAVNTTIDSGLAHAELISVPLTLIILVLAFGALVAASVPLLLGLTSVAAAMGAVGLISQLVPEGTSTAPVVILVGLAVGIDYSLFYVRRFRAERRSRPGQATLDATAATAATVGRAVLVAGATVVIGLAGLLFTGLGTFTSLALGAIVVVAIAVIGSLTVLPATLALLGDRIDRGRLRLPAFLRSRRSRRRHVAVSRRGSLWGRLAAAVCGHPRTSLAGAVAVTAALAVPLLTMNLSADGIDALPPHAAARIAAQDVSRAFAGADDAGQLVVSGHALGSVSARAALAQLGRRGRALDGGHGQVSVAVDHNGGVASVSFPVPDGGLGQSTGDVHRLRAVLEPATQRMLAGAHAQLTGSAASNVDVNDRLSTATPVVIVFVLALAFVLLMATFGSATLAVSVIALNLLSVGAAFGILVAIFQGHWAQSLLGFTSTGGIVDWLPLFAFVILFGLSMDYTVLVLERAAESRRDGAGPREAAQIALAQTGATVSSAALVMVAVFSVFASLPVLDLKEMGVGLAAAVALDATVVRAIALPAALTLLGDRGLKPSRAEGTRPAPLAPEPSDWEHAAYATTVGSDHGH
jgi:uncharacterized membrane protein YdfJ with MMPL/SSD domain